MAKKNINKVVIAPITVSTIACREQLHKALQPIKIDAENQAYLKSLLASAERELEKANYQRNWVVREVPLDILEIDMDYQREPKDSELAKILLHFEYKRTNHKTIIILQNTENTVVNAYRKKTF